MPTSPICEILETVVASDEFICENEHWILKHAARPYPAAGWLVLISKRHVAGPAYFTASEQTAIGPAISAFSRAIIDKTGALRVYVASMNESSPHFHMHLVPRYEDGKRGWPLFAEQERAAKGEIHVRDDLVSAVIRDLTVDVILASPRPPR